MPTPTRPCAVCGTIVTPWSADTITAHETNCYLTHPDKIPAEHREHHAGYLLHKSRSEAAMRGVATRRARKTSYTKHPNI